VISDVEYPHFWSFSTYASTNISAFDDEYAETEEVKRNPDNTTKRSAARDFLPKKEKDHIKRNVDKYYTIIIIHVL